MLYRLDDNDVQRYVLDGKIVAFTYLLSHPNYQIKRKTETKMKIDTSLSVTVAVAWVTLRVKYIKEI